MPVIANVCFSMILILSAPAWLQGDDSIEGDWHLLFDGKTLDGWESLPDDGQFFVQDGAIVGETSPDTKSRFLCTKRTFDNFVLELEFKVDRGLNSGIQIRSDTHPKDISTLYLSGKLELVPRSFPKGSVFGYQIEIDTSDRAWTGGFYEEGRRGWLQTLEYNEPARRAFKQGEWNQLRIEAVNDSIKSWVNGTPAIDTHDAWARSGRIGLQLHSSKELGKRVRFRNLRLKIVD